MPYVTIITHYVKSLGDVNARYEMLPLVVSYIVASITMVGYRDSNNDGNFVTIKGVGDDDNDEDQALAAKSAHAYAPQVQHPGDPSFIEVMGALTMLGEKFKRFQDQVWARFDSLGEQIASVDRKVSIGGECDKP